MRYFGENKGGCVWRYNPETGDIHFRWSGDNIGWLRSCCKLAEFLTPDGSLREGNKEFKQDPFDD